MRLLFALLILLGLAHPMAAYAADESSGGQPEPTEQTADEAAEEEEPDCD